ncbi:MAG: tetratricopeptide repeat protein [Planctomycetota bacterium]
MAKKNETKNEAARPGEMIRWIAITAVLLAVIGIAFWLTSAPTEIAEEELTPRYIGRSSCVDCHQQEVELFHGSHHDMAMDLATDATVLGDFNDASIEHFGVTSRLFRDGDRYMVNTEGPDGEMHDYEVKFVFGVHPLQQYMVELEPARSPETDRSGNTTDVSYESSPLGRVQVLRISWDVKRNEWFYLLPPDVNEKIEPGDPLHWTGFTQCWNTSCAVCHSTNLQKNFDQETATFATTFTEIDVSCEACHGPASLHVHMAEQKIAFPHEEHGYGLARLKMETNMAQIESCAPCHSRRSETTTSYVSGRRFDDHFNCTLLTRGIYHDDGQIRDEDYVYGSFLQSKMYHNGIRCTDCHDPHSGQVKYPDNRLCTSCHQHPAGKYDSPSHHHHAAGSTGASCVECHMPSTTYMACDPRRDHSFRIPRPDLSVTLNTPNACTACHLDSADPGEAAPQQYLDWIVLREQGDEHIEAELAKLDQQMAAAFESWYPEGSSAIPRVKYYEQLALGRADGAGAIGILRELAVDGSAPAIVRASALEELIAHDDRGAIGVAVDAIDDRDAKVAAAAIRLLEYLTLIELERIQYSENPGLGSLNTTLGSVARMFSHESRLVRIEAARVFAGMPEPVRQHCATTSQRRSFEKALGELIESLLTNNDRATSHMMLGTIYEALDQNDRAQQAFRTAIRVDPDITGPRASLAGFLENRITQLQRNLSSARGGSALTQSTMTQIATLQTEADELRAQDHELLRLDLQRAEGLPGIHRLHYQFAMSSFLQREIDSVEKHLLIALEEVPDSPDYLLALATFYVEQEDFEQASARVDQLLGMDPDNPGYLSLKAKIIRSQQ